MNLFFFRLDWRFVRSLGELPILTRASYAMLAIVPLLAGVWTSVIWSKLQMEAHPVVPGSPICGMRMPSAAGARGHSVAASDRRLDSPAGPKGRRNFHRHADKQLKAPEKLEIHPPFQISPATPIC